MFNLFYLLPPLTFVFEWLTDTLDAYIDKYLGLVPFLADSTTGAAYSDPPPVDQTLKAISLQVR